ncbi:unnamed protein product [Mytilus coruscus]|uniref:Uncharacterized protein n=1 Tax=Mytilus coruscus TaxID=42192 RepID=A0A6J8AIZ5_MYTCO|nr:unnamed protein product [Mytilus coruscus]
MINIQFYAIILLLIGETPLSLERRPGYCKNRITKCDAAIGCIWNTTIATSHEVEGPSNIEWTTYTLCAIGILITIGVCYCIRSYQQRIPTDVRIVYREDEIEMNQEIAEQPNTAPQTRFLRFRRLFKHECCHHCRSSIKHDISDDETLDETPLADIQRSRVRKRAARNLRDVIEDSEPEDCPSEDDRRTDEFLETSPDILHQNSST